MLVLTNFGAAKVLTVHMPSGYICAEPNPERWSHGAYWTGVLMDGCYVGRTIEGPTVEALPLTVH